MSPRERLKRRSLHLVAYDVADRRRRRRLRATIRQWGLRTQRSVFWAWLGEGEAERLADAASAWLRPEEDSLVIVRCAGAPYTYGALAHRPEDLPLLAWIV